MKCDNCGNIIQGTRNKKNKHNFCNKKCFGEWISKNMHGEDSGKWTGGKITILCDNCGNIIERWESNIIGEYNFCDQKCHGEWRSKHKIPITKTKSKVIYTHTDEGMGIVIRCFYNPKTTHNTISTGFYKSSDSGMEGNKKCSSYLGVHIAETVLSELYNGYVSKSYGNPGYDFLCGKGHKIDVKSSCLGGYKNSSWAFSIKKNVVADYFLCLAFDNRDDLNPKHIWLIPGDIINKKTGITISKSTISNWSEYEQNNLDEIIKCCNTMKNNNY